MSEPAPFFVVAPSYAWFEAWCWDRQLNPRDRRQAIYVREPRHFEGYRLNSEQQIVDLGPFDPKRYDLVLGLMRRVRPEGPVLNAKDRT